MKISMPPITMKLDMSDWLYKIRPLNDNRDKVTASLSCVQCITDKKNKCLTEVHTSSSYPSHVTSKTPKNFQRKFQSLEQTCSNLEVFNLLHTKTRISNLVCPTKNVVPSRNFVDIIFTIDRSPFTKECKWNRYGDNNPKKGLMHARQ